MIHGTTKGSRKNNLIFCCRLMQVPVMAMAIHFIAGPIVEAQEQEGNWWLTVYLQQSFPRQTNTNMQIEQINQTFGADFDTWDDVANLSVGGQLFHRVSNHLKIGCEVDYSRGGLEGEATVVTIAGPAGLSFKQKYSMYLNLLGVAHILPCASCERVIPFVLAGGGIGYEKDQTTLNLQNEFLDMSLLVDNDGSFPVATLGVGIDVPFTSGKSWYIEAGGAYYWGRLKHHVPAQGSLAPAPEVLADTDSTGPNYWIGIGKRF